MNTQTSQQLLIPLLLIMLITLLLIMLRHPLLVLIMLILLLMLLLLGVAEPDREGTREGRVLTRPASERACLKGKGDALHYVC